MLMKCKMKEFLMNTAECTLRRVKQWQCECSRGEKVDSNAGNAVAATQAKPICQLTFFLLLLLSLVLHIFYTALIFLQTAPSQRRFFVLRKLVSVTHIKKTTSVESDIKLLNHDFTSEIPIGT